MHPMHRWLCALLLLPVLLLPASASALTITVTEITPAAPAGPNEADVQTLARIIYWEARGEPDEGKLAVGQVVLNRVASDLFPDTIEEVIAQKGQFSPWGCEGYDAAELPEDCLEAARMVLDGLGELPADVLWFRSDQCVEAWGIANWYTTIGGHHFYQLR